MRLSILAAWVCLSVAAGAAAAADRVALGYGTIFNNDAIGDGKDRWRTASFGISALYAARTTGDPQMPAALGELLEYRFRTEILTAANSENPAPGDRRYAGIVSFGAHSHAAYDAFELSLGGDLVFVGPMTRIGLYQRRFHGWFGMDLPDITNQLPNAVYPTVTGEAALPFRVGGALHLRPFVEAGAGIESFVRIGADLRLGDAIGRDLMLRDTVTGQRYRGATAPRTPGYSFVLGADVAHVFDSHLLPGDDGYVLTDHRARVRAGLHWQTERAGLFYGVTWLSQEFEGQPEGQVVGSMQLTLSF